LDRLCAEHPHFGRFAALLPNFAEAIQAGTFDAERGRT